MDSDHQVRVKIREELPPEVFVRKPLRALLLIPLMGIVIGGSLAVATLPLPWYIAAVIAMIVGNFYASMMFFSHEVIHGAIVKKRWLQTLLSYPGCTIFCLSPHLWRIWHNCSHHAHTNQPGQDPDNFGTLEEFDQVPKFSQSFAKLAPGSAHWLSAIYLFAFFTIQAQHVLWVKSSRMPGYRGLNRWRAALDTSLMTMFWILICVVTGWVGTVFVVVIPMLIANFVVLSYVVTNHMLRPLTDRANSLGSAMSVTTFRLLDAIHFHFSHHVEHHLFPAVCGKMAPKIRAALVKHYDHRYLAPPHWRALLMVFQTPRVYDGYHALVDPFGSKRVVIRQVEKVLESHQRTP